MPSAQITKLFSEAIRAAIPDGSLTVSTWSPTYRVLSPERTNTERAGKWSNHYVPHLVEIMDAFDDPECEEIVFIKSSQIAGTEFINNCCGKSIHISPGPTAYLGEDEGKAKAWKRECFDLMVRDSEVLRNLVSDGRGRNAENTQIGASFPGGRLNILWATSPATVSSRPIQYLYIDERDAMGPTKEGDATSLARARVKTFKGSRKIVTISSPRNRLENAPDAPPDTPRRSPIEHEYHSTDRRKRFVLCPHCETFQVLAWFEDRCSCPPGDEPCDLNHGHVKWDNDDPSSAYYVCCNGCVITEEERLEILHHGVWRPSAEFRGKKGFWINELYSTFSSLAEMADAYVEAKNDPSGEKMKAFLNTRLAEAYEERDAEIDTDDLLELQETYDDSLIPEDVHILTASVDVQSNRLEREVKGYGVGPVFDPKVSAKAIIPQCWGIEFQAIDGDPALNDVWNELENLRKKVYRTPSGRQLRVTITAIDTNYLPSRVYKFIRQHKGRGYVAVRGANTPGKPLISKPSKAGDPPVRLWTIGTETAKDSIANRLELKDKNAPGFCHFGAHYPEAYFKQLRAEQPVTRYYRGKAYRCWEKIKEWYRNEALDLFVYNEAALAIALRVLKTNFITLARKANEEIERLYKTPDDESAEVTDPPDQMPDPEDDDDNDDEVTFNFRRSLIRSGRKFVRG